uniref:ENTH domain-containing protein n=1 Tax=Kalanchoe fedtschenkoi TaxID=63787 RepID=A0A7N0TWN8_KALFE
MPSKLKKAIGAVKDNTSIGLAKVGSSTSVSDLEVAVVKATRHVEYPAEEKHVREILSLTSYSRAYVSACVGIIARRLNKTRNWTVALKALMLIHRLLSEGDPSYEAEVFFTTRRGTRLLNLSDFRDNSQSNSWDFSAFVRTYALYLDEKLEFRMQGRRGKRSAFVVAEEEEEVRESRYSSPGRGGRDNNHRHDRQVAVRATPVREMKVEQLFSRAQHLQQLLERALACRPTGAAKVNRLVIVALYPIVKESFQVYYEMTEIMSIMIDQFMGMKVPDCVKVHENFVKISKQFEEVDGFYEWCKTEGIARSSEYPEVERISQKKLDVMYEFIREKSTGRREEEVEDHEEEEKELVEEESKQVEREVEVEEEDMNKMKALPPPEGFEEEAKEKVVKEEEVDESRSLAVVQQEADLLNLGADAPTTEQHADSLALALFDGLSRTNPVASSAPAWQAFATDENWEEALVQSASYLSNQPVSLAGGFDMLLLDGMYQQQAIKAATMGAGATGSGSSVAIGSAGKPAMLALPAPPTDGSGAQQPAYVDPFAASLAVPPPAYVQMSEMERKQKLLVEEQLMWQHYGSDQMQGHLAYHKVQAAHQNPYNTGNYQQRF